MGIIFNGFHKPEYFGVIQDVCERFNPTKCHIIYESERIRLHPDIIAKFYACAFLSHVYNYEEPQDFLPLDADLITQLSDCEAVCLKMMERDEISGLWSYEKRKRAYLKHLRYWHHVIKSDKISLFLTSNIPHVIYDFIIYSLCKLYGIQTVLFYQFQPGLSFIMRDWKEPTPGLDQEMKSMQNLNNSQQLSELSISDRLRREIEDNAGLAGIVTPFYMLQPPQPEHSGMLHFLKSLASRVKAKTKKFTQLPLLLVKIPLVVAREYNRIREHYRARKHILNLKQNYEAQCIEPDLHSDYVYLPLHLQPELSTAPMAGAFVDQLLIAEMIDYHLPEKALIYVKEHPNQKLEKRERDFYAQFLRCPKVRFISRSFDSRKLIAGSKVVATCTGTAGWEALLSLKPVLLFGYTFFQDAPGVYQTRTNSDCELAIKKIWTENKLVSKNEIELFLHLLDAHAVYADIDPDYMNSRNANWQENTLQIVRAIENFVHR